MEEQKFITGEVKKHLQASAGKNRYQVIDAGVRRVYTPLLRICNGRNTIPRRC